jgi:hypothetical protein
VAQSNIVWQSPQLQGYGAGLSVVDLENDGEPELIALTDAYLYVFSRPNASSAYSQRSSVALQSGSRVLAADTDGDGEYEIYVITGSYYYSSSEIRVFSETLAPLRTLTLTVRATNLVLEPSAFARRNLLVTTGNAGCCYQSSVGEIWAIDAQTGTGVWRSPGLPGEITRNSLHPLDVNLDGQYELAFGTQLGAFVTR